MGDFPAAGYGRASARPICSEYGRAPAAEGLISAAERPHRTSEHALLPIDLARKFRELSVVHMSVVKLLGPTDHRTSPGWYVRPENGPKTYRPQLEAHADIPRPR
jgi:hypothetical protein